MLAIVVLAMGLSADPPAPLWEVPYCDGRPKDFVGIGLAVPVPKGSKAKTVTDVDYACTTIRLRERGLSFTACDGPDYTRGRPSSSLLRGARDVVERRVRWPDMPEDWAWDYGPVDVRGTSAEGTRWRYIGMYGGSIVYEDVAAGSEQALDAVLDRLCWRHRPQK